MLTGLKSFEQFDSGVSLIKVDLKCCFGHWLAQNLLDVWKDGMVTLLSNGWVPSRVVRHWQGQEGWRAPLSCLSSTALLQIACLQPPPRFTIITSLLSRVATERDLIKVHLGGATQKPIQSKHWISILQKNDQSCDFAKNYQNCNFSKVLRFDFVAVSTKSANINMMSTLMMIWRCCCNSVAGGLTILLLALLVALVVLLQLQLLLLWYWDLYDCNSMVGRLTINLLGLAFLSCLSSQGHDYHRDDHHGDQHRDLHCDHDVMSMLVRFMMMTMSIMADNCTT